MWRIPLVPVVSDAGVMTSFTHDTAPTQYAEADGTHFAYRRFGSPGRPPPVFFQHFMGNLDDHDPALSDVVGHSMGGLVAQEVTLACPDLVRRLVLARHP